MGLVMPWRCSRHDLEAMLSDRIRQADPSWLVRPLTDSPKPLHASCGFRDVAHEDRVALDGGRSSKDVFDAIVRHTRIVPR
jgi:hypothetical protein